MDFRARTSRRFVPSMCDLWSRISICMSFSRAFSFCLSEVRFSKRVMSFLLFLINIRLSRGIFVWFPRREVFFGGTNWYATSINIFIRVLSLSFGGSSFSFTQLRRDWRANDNASQSMSLLWKLRLSSGDARSGFSSSSYEVVHICEFTSTTKWSEVDWRGLIVS